MAHVYIPSAVSLGGLGAGSWGRHRALAYEERAERLQIHPGSREGGWWAYFQKSHILHILCGFRTFLSKWMTAVCVSITSFKREKTVGKSDSSYTHTHTHTHTHTCIPHPPAPQDSDLNSTAGRVGLGAASGHLPSLLKCSPSR